MSKRTLSKSSISLLIGLTALSLVGLVITQVFWINNALKLADEQFDNRVTIALQGALDEYVNIVGENINKSEEGCLSCNLDDSIFINLIPEKIDSLLNIHFDYHGLGTNFGFAVVKCDTGEILYKKEGAFSKNTDQTIHRISLSCLKHEDSHHMEVVFPSKRNFVLMETAIWLIISVIFLLIVIITFAFTVLTIIRQKKVSEIRNDFINNMTHEFKTPIANISLASEVLMRDDTKSNSTKIDQYVKIIQQENLRMRSQVERVLQVAMRNKEDHTIRKEETDIHELIKQAVDHACFQDCHEDAKISYYFKAKESILYIDPMHFSNIVHNLIENAQKYSEGQPEISIHTKTKGKSIYIDFIDKGIGIAPVAQKYVFDKFYRVPTGNIHNVKGFGLGLNYVKNMIEAQGGQIQLSSEPGKGSCFTLVFPLS